MTRAGRVLLRLYPAAFRAEYGDEFVAVLRRHRRQVSGLAVASFWLATLLDTLSGATGAHLDILRQDLRYAGRTLNRSRGFAAATVVILALGIGANTAVLSLADHVFVRALPFADPDRLVGLWEDHGYRGYSRVEPSPANFRDWTQAATSFEAMAASYSLSVNMTGGGEPRRLEGAAVTAGLFPLLGVRPALGRVFSPSDDRPGAAGTLLLSDGAWQELFARDPAVLGRQVTLDGTPYTVIGVMPAAFRYPAREVTFWTTTRFDEEMFVDRTNNFLRVVGRLKRGVSLPQAAAGMRVVASALERAHPKENERVGVTLKWLRDDVSEQSRLLLLALAGGALCVLLIACTNLANLLMARAMSRRPELAVRAALGAGGDRLVRQLLTEALVLAAAGGALGAVLAAAALPLFDRLVPASLPIAARLTMDGRALGIAAVLTALTTLGFGVVPGLRACRAANLESLKAGGRSIGVAHGGLRPALVVVEVGASVLLLATAVVLLQTLWRVEAIDPGFRPEGVLTLRTVLATPKYEPLTRRMQFYSRVVSEVRALPGVSGAAYTTGLPLVMRGGIWPVAVDGKPLQPGDRQAVLLRVVTPGYFDAMGIRLRAGRDITDGDTADRPRVAVVSESFVRQFWPGENPLGRRLRVALADRTVVGVVGDVRVRGRERQSEPQVYLPPGQQDDAAVSVYAPRALVVRGPGDLAALLPAIRGIVRRADPEQPISEIRTLADVLDEESAPRLVQLRILTAFAALAFALAATGIHAVLSYTVVARRREIGVRIALGATRLRILRDVAGSALALSALGTLAGLAGAWAVARAMRSLLVGADTANLEAGAVICAMALLMTLAGAVAPAIRAVRVNPTDAIRSE